MTTLALLAAGPLAHEAANIGIAVLIIAGIIGIVLTILTVTKTPVPQWLITILWIIFAVVVGIIAIKFLVSVV